MAHEPKSLSTTDLRLEGILPVFIWKKVYFGDGPPAFSGHVWSE